jgi:hypothetical protein
LGRLLRLPITVFGLAKVAILTTNIDTKHKLQTYEKVSYEALNRHFCQTDVIGMPLLSVTMLSVGKTSSFAILGLCGWLVRIANVLA